MEFVVTISVSNLLQQEYFFSEKAFDAICFFNIANFVLFMKDSNDLHMFGDMRTEHEHESLCRKGTASDVLFSDN